MISKDWHRIRFLESLPVKQRKKDMKFNGKKDQRWQVSSDISKSHTHFQWEEPMYVRALQCHSGENVYMSTFSPNKIEKGDASLLYHVGFRTWRFNKISSTCAMRISNKQRQKRSVLLSRFAIGSEPRPEVQAFTSTWRTIMKDCLWWIWKQRRIRWDSIRQRTGVSCATTQFRPSSSQRSSTSKTDQKGSEKKNIKRSKCLPRKRADTTTDSRGKPPGTTQNKRQ